MLWALPGFVARDVGRTQMAPLRPCSVCALEADAHAVEAELGTLYRQMQALQGLLEGHVAVGLVLQLVPGLHQRVEQARDNGVLVHALHQIYSIGSKRQTRHESVRSVSRKDKSRPVN